MSEEYTPTIEKEELAPGLVVYRNVIPGHHQLIPYIEQIAYSGMAEWKVANIAGKDVETMSFDYPKEFKDPNDFSVQFEERISLVVAGFLGVAENDYTVSNSLPQKSHDKLGLIKYSNGVSFPLSSGQDNSSIMILYFLNDEYQGSTLEFPNLGITYQPKENEALIFPFAEGYEYSVSELIDGTKYAFITYLRMS